MSEIYNAFAELSAKKFLRQNRKR